MQRCPDCNGRMLDAGLATAFCAYKRTSGYGPCGQPRLLERCLIGAPSWTVVIARLTRARDEVRLDSHEADRDAAFHADVPTHRESVQSLARIMERISDAR